MRTKTETDPLFEAYRQAKARHDAAIAALKQASSGRKAPDPALVKAQAAAALEEFEALAALRRAID